MARSSTRKNVVASFAIGVRFLWLAFKGIDLAALGDALKGAHYLYIVPACLLMVLLTVLRTLRLNYILRPIREIGFVEGFSIASIGFMAINLFPARLGEIVRPWLLAEREDVPMGAGLAAVLVERLYDFLSMVALLFIVAIFIDLPVDSIQLFGTKYTVLELGRRMAILLAGPVVAFVVSLIVFEPHVMALARVMVRPLPVGLGAWLMAALGMFIKAIHGVKDPRTGLTIGAYTALIWIVTPLGQWLCLLAFDLHLGYSGAVAVLAATLVGLLIPAPPGFAGTFEVFAMAGVALFQVEGEVALAFALVVHGVQFFSTMAMGLVFLWRDGISFASLSDAVSKLRAGGEEAAAPP